MQGSAPVYAFGEWRLDASQRLLFRSGALEPLPPKVLETLLILVENHGRVVEKDEILSRLWPGTFVEEGNVLRNVSTLRKALGDGDEGAQYIETIPKRGYRFVAPVTVVNAADDSSPVTSAPLKTRFSPWLIGLLAAAALVLAAILTWQWFARSSSNDQAVIAVLPFENLSGDPAQEYLADGLTEEMITQLATLDPGRFLVIARTSSMKYKGTRKSVQDIGRELGVDYVLEGSIRGEAGRLRISAQLIRVSDQIHLWAKSYDRDLSGVVAMQADVSDVIAGQIHATLTPSAKAARRRHTVDAEAYEAYLKGRFEWNKRTPDGLRKGLEHFAAALARDPNYAAAYAGIADSYNMLTNYTVLSPAEGFPRALDAARKAIAIDDALAEAHASLGFATFHHEYDWAAAEKAYRRAIQLNPSYAAAHQWYAELLICMGRYQESLERARRAQQLDPLSLNVRVNIGRSEWLGRHFDRAAGEMRSVLELQPDNLWANVYLAMSLSSLGKHDEALAAAEKTKPMTGGRPGFLLAYCHARASNAAQAREILGYWTEHRVETNTSPVFLAGIHAALGEKDAALNMLELAVDERALFVPYMAAHPWLDPLHSEPRFRALLRKLNLPEQIAPSI